ncbi:hypothetical protein [Rhizobium sp. BE258]|uniref:hypothetical protein n=1 Tax=Rhizobium sp. BE258 TaxID=2817722 RepID=UPI00285B9F56|nr:hypothetical protein [Rhizobium sp. BE258]MDR7145226.1 hypothetical protein [Rhizobium sp. BE258]
MKLKAFALAAAFSVAVLNVANAALPAAVSHNDTNVTKSQASSLLSAWVAQWTTVFQSNFGDDWSSDTQNSAIKGTTIRFISGLFQSDNTPYSQSFSWNSSTGIASYSTPAAVPGPEAGAGIGALALGGAAIYMTRRRKQENLAA